ncbi:MAG: PRTRC system protein E [Alistipes sp.]|jgi:PRTRC genetic system protein E|nr:PRTRC system protein E [Alistipes sp.]
MFFTYFKQIMSPGVDYNLTISQTAAGDLVVIVLPKVHDLKDTAQHQIGPLKLSGSAEELDGEFFPRITAPVQKTSGLLVNMAEYERQQDAAAAESKAVKDEKAKVATEAKAKKEKCDGFIKKADEMEAAGNLDGALLQLQQARLHAADKTLKTVDERIVAMKAKVAQTSLFDAPSPQPAVTTPPPVASEPLAQSQPVAVSAQPEQVAAPPPAAMFQPISTQPVCRDHEYDGYEDFPTEMRPPLYQGGAAAAGAM